MRQFENLVSEANDLHRVTNWYGSSGLSFYAHETERINLFVEALQTVSGIENISISKPNKYGVVSVWCDRTTAIASAIFHAIAATFVA